MGNIRSMSRNPDAGTINEEDAPPRGREVTVSAKVSLLYFVLYVVDADVVVGHLIRSRRRRKYPLNFRRQHLPFHRKEQGGSGCVRTGDTRQKKSRTPERSRTSFSPT